MLQKLERPLHWNERRGVLWRPALPCWVRLCLALLLVGSLLLPLGVTAAEYAGLWRIDEKSAGIQVSYPENGFAGACVSLSGGSEVAGEIRLLSQINRHRFGSVVVSVSGDVDPVAVHVQMSVKGKSVWGATEYSFESLDVVVPLNGEELAIEALELVAGANPWTVTFCGMEFSNEQYALRFTSDCAGLDFVSSGASLRLVADEDWVALGREMTGGMALFRLAGAWGYQDASLQVATTFPSQLFYVALAVDEEPVLQPGESMSGLFEYEGGDQRDYALVVKGKGHTLGSVDWRASISWEVSGGAPPEVMADALELQEDVAGLGDTLATNARDAREMEKLGGGCHSTDRAGSPGVLLLLVLLALGGCLIKPEMLRRVRG